VAGSVYPKPSGPLYACSNFICVGYGDDDEFPGHPCEAVQTKQPLTNPKPIIVPPFVKPVLEESASEAMP
jgi:hypothetical protein